MLRRVSYFVGLALACALFSPTPQALEIYQWRDKEGRLHFTDDASKVPPVYRKSKKYLSGSRERPSEVHAGERVWREKCASCHHLGRGFRGELRGLGHLLTDSRTRLPRKEEDLLLDLKYAVSGRATLMPEIKISDDALQQLARYMLSQRRP